MYQKILGSLFIIIFLMGCANHPPHQSSDKKSAESNNNPNKFNRIQFKCSAINYREKNPFTTSITDISVGDTLVFATYGSCTAAMTTIIKVNEKDKSFITKEPEGKKIKLRINAKGKIIGENPLATEMLAKKYFTLGIIKSHSMFQEAQ